MSETKATGVRARVRAQLTAEIKEAAKTQIAAEGASQLSLRAISRELGMASSAIYRYFASRDELLTQLIIDAYDTVGDIAEQANASCEQTDYLGRWMAMALAIRVWAVENPHEYALIFGSPVPGYVAPADTIDPATRAPLALMSALLESAGPRGRLTKESKRVAKMLASFDDVTDSRFSPDRLAAVVQAWAQVIGLISFELFGHMVGSVDETAEFFEHSMRDLAGRILDGDAAR